MIIYARVLISSFVCKTLFLHSGLVYILFVVGRALWALCHKFYTKFSPAWDGYCSFLKPNDREAVSRKSNVPTCSSSQQECSFGIVIVVNAQLLATKLASGARICIPNHKRMSHVEDPVRVCWWNVPNAIQNTLKRDVAIFTSCFTRSQHDNLLSNTIPNFYY